jgi:hypothetical protein
MYILPQYNKKKSPKLKKARKKKIITFDLLPPIWQLGIYTKEIFQ